MSVSLATVTSVTGRLNQTVDVNSENIDEALDNLRDVTENLKGIFAVDGTAGTGTVAALRNTRKAHSVKLIGYDAYQNQVEDLKGGISALSWRRNRETRPRSRCRTSWTLSTSTTSTRSRRA